MQRQRMVAFFMAALLFTACAGDDRARPNAGANASGSQNTKVENTATDHATATGVAGSNATKEVGVAGMTGIRVNGTSAASGASSSAVAGAGGVVSSAAGSAGLPAANGIKSAAGGAGQGAAGAAATSPSTAQSDDCDRACLLAVMQRYLDALVAHDASMLKVASTLKTTDNGVVAKLGDGLFKTGTMVLNDHRLDFADPLEGNVATQVVINEGSEGVIYQARLKVVKHEITEIESMTVHQQGAANNFFNIDNMKPEPVFLEKIPAETRMPREKLKEITEMYLDYLEGKRTGSEVPFDDGCKRYENGQVTAMGISGFEAQSFWMFMVTRRILIIDEEAGITWGMFPFFQTDNTLVVGEAFKIIDGKIKMIQAVMANQPAKIWD